jgi:hypothetical protein
MQPRVLLSLIAITASLLALTACGFEDPEPPGSTPKPDAGIVAPDAEPSGTLQPPVVDPTPNPVCADSVPLQGSAVAGASVIVFGGASSAISTDANPVTGRFCVDVPLLKDADNNLQVRAQDPLLGMSPPVSITVTQDKCTDDVPNPTPEQPKSKNVALGATAKAVKSAEEGNEGFLTDGDAVTFAKYCGGNAWMSWDGWVFVKLDKLYPLEKIVVRWHDGDEYGAKYKVLTSAMSDPGDPDLKNGYWTQVGEVTEGDGGTDTFNTSSTKPLAQYVALWLEQDGASWTWSECFAIAEIEAWDVPQQSTTPTPTQGNTCASISSGS